MEYADAEAIVAALNHFETRDQAAAHLGVSTRALMRWAAKLRLDGWPIDERTTGFIFVSLPYEGADEGRRGRVHRRRRRRRA